MNNATAIAHPADVARDTYEAAMKRRDDYEMYLSTARLRDWSIARTNVSSMKITERQAFNAWLAASNGVATCKHCRRVSCRCK